jgi:broad specificity phosphatase PhoE
MGGGQEDIPKFAAGGVIDRPTLLVDEATGRPSGEMAEAGPEQISPLSGPGPLEPKVIPVRRGKRGKPSQMPSLADNPTAAQPTIPESPQTLQMQLMQLQQGKRHTVMFPKGTQVPQLIPNTPLHKDAHGNLYAYDPERINPAQINAAVATNRLPEILGDAEIGMGAPDKSQLRGAVANVIGRTMDGTTVQSTASDEENLQSAIEATKRVTPPGGTVSVEPAQNEINNRVANGAQPPSTEGNGPSNQSGEYFRGAWNIDLNQKGREEAQRLARNTAGQFHQINAGTLNRHRETAAAISAANPQAGPVNHTDALNPWTLGGHEGNAVTPDRTEDLNDRVRNRPDEPIPGVGQHSGKPGESFNQFKNPLLALVLQEKSQWRPGMKILNLTSGRDVQAVRAAAAAGFPDDLSVNHDVMTAPWKTQPGQMMVLDPRTNQVADVQDAYRDGIYFGRHGETDANDPIQSAGNGQPGRLPSGARSRAISNILGIMRSGRDATHEIGTAMRAGLLTPSDMPRLRRMGKAMPKPELSAPAPIQ